MTTEVTAYKTSDGELFESRFAADRHEHRLDFADWYNEPNSLAIKGQDHIHRTVQPNDLMNWLISHRQRVLEFLDSPLTP